MLFAVEQNLGHAAIAANLRRAFAGGGSVDGRFVDVTFYEPGGVIERLPAPHWLRGALRARRQIGAGIARAHPDGLYIHTQAAALLCHDYLWRIPTALSLDATPRQYDAMGEAYGHAPERIGLLARAKHLSVRRVFSLARLLVATSAWVRDSLVRDYGVKPERVIVLPPGADLARWHPAPPTSSRAAKRVLFVGGDFHRKGGDLLLDWLANSPAADDVVLDIVTQTPIPPAERANVHLGLRHDDLELLALAQSADVFALPTLADCYSLATIEAMGAGLPAVVSAVGGIGDIVEDGTTGFLVPAGDARAFSARLDQLLSDASLRDRMGAAARARAVARFDARANLAQLREALEAMVDEDRHQRKR